MRAHRPRYPLCLALATMLGSTACGSPSTKETAKYSGNKAQTLTLTEITTTPDGQSAITGTMGQTEANKYGLVRGDFRAFRIDEQQTLAIYAAPEITYEVLDGGKIRGQFTRNVADSPVPIKRPMVMSCSFVDYEPYKYTVCFNLFHLWQPNDGVAFWLFDQGISAVSNGDYRLMYLDSGTVVASRDYAVSNIDVSPSNILNFDKCTAHEFSVSAQPHFDIEHNRTTTLCEKIKPLYYEKEHSIQTGSVWEVRDGIQNEERNIGHLWVVRVEKPTTAFFLMYGGVGAGR